MTTVISIEDLSKTYRLGQIGSGTVAHDLNVWWAKMRGKPNPMLRIGEKDSGDFNDGELWALKDISFKVQQGEVLGIIGRNGAGKSTLLKILSRVTAPTSGTVKVKGRIASLLEVGTGFHPELTGRENIYLNGAILGMNRKEIDRKFDEIVDFAGVEKFIDTPVKRYSSGMYVRLAFAVAAHLEPEILIVDEVLAVGDAEFQKKCLGKMSDIAHKGRTVLFVSHNMGAINQLCTKAILLKNGGLELYDKTDITIQRYIFTDKINQLSIDIDPATRLNLETLFISASIQNIQEQLIDFVNINEPFVVRLDVLARKEISNIDVSIRVGTATGYSLFTSNLSDELNSTISLPSGISQFSITIPANYLMPDVYTLTAVIQQPFIELLDRLDNIIKFEIITTKSEVWRYSKYQGKDYGNIFTKFPWKVWQLENP